MRNLARFIAIIRVLIRYRIDALILSASFLRRFKPLLYLTPWHYIPRKKITRGKRIRLALEELGPIFIKFGQTLSTRRDLLPEDIGDELAKLQNTCPSFDNTQAKIMIEASLDGSIEQLFSKFNIEQPLASASIAQVYTAVTHQGDEVVVKVVRPDIGKIIKRDIALMYIFAQFVSKYPISKKIRPTEIVAEFELIILSELNMLTEAKNAAQLRENFQNSDLLYVPKVHWDLCSKEVLTTERVYGTPVGDIAKLKADNINLKKLAEEGVIIFFTQVFKHNFFHADMHPGNIFISPEGRYIGVDFGIMGVLEESDKDFLANIFLAFFNQDYHGVASAYIESGWVSTSTDMRAFEKAIGKICEPMFEKTLNEISFGQVLIDLMAEAKNFNITIQPQLLLLDKTLLNIEGLGRQLYPQLDLWATAKPFLEELVKEKYSMKSTIEKLKEKAPELLKEIPEIPSLVSNALNQMNNISNIQSEQTNAIISQLKDNSNRQTSAILSGALLILSGVLTFNNFWIAASISVIVALIFWIKSR